MRRFFNLVVALVLCSTTFFAISCEDEISDVGSGLIDTGASANAYYVDVVSFNTNNDSIRSDEQMLQSAVVGVYEEPVFGRTKARFISQARLGSLNPTFGENPVMDSVILNVPVYFVNKEDDIQIDTTYIYLAEGETPSDTATMRLKRTYKLDSLYGNSQIPITLQVREVSKYLYSQDSIYYSNRTLANCPSCENINDIETFPTVLGSLQVTNKLITYQEKKRDATNTDIPPIVLKVKLDKDYFKQKFIDNEGSADLADQASFIRNFFRGIELSVVESQGFLMAFNQSSASFNLNMFYSHDNPEEGGDKLNKILNLNFGSYWSATPGYNVQVNQFEHQNRSSQFVNAYTNPNTTEGDARLYLAGMDGTKAKIRLDQNQLNEIKNNVQNNGWAIVGAELSFHIDDSYGLKKPPYLFAWNSYTEDGKKKDVNFEDIAKFYNSYPFSVQFNPMYDYKENKKTYIIRITDYIKSIVERGEVYEDNLITLSLGNFLLSPNGGYMNVVSPTNPFLNNRAFNPYRVVLHGNNTEQADKKLRLKIYYTKK
ncbi:MAG: DUF4270 domain-containing protein [Weeksellaceae bacterium]